MIRQQRFKMAAIAAAALSVGGAWALVCAQEKAGGQPRSPGALGPSDHWRPVPNLPGTATFYSQQGRDGWAAYAVPVDNDPELAKLAGEESELAHSADEVLAQYVAAEKADDQKRLKSELREALAKQFDVQKQRREFELKRIEERVQKLKDQIKKRNDARETIIDRRLEQLTNEAEGLGWGQPAGNVSVRPPVNFYRDNGAGPRAK